MAKAILDDLLWSRIEACLPRLRHERRGPGRQPIPDRAALTGILFVLKSRIPWEELPVEMGCGSGMTCLRRLRRWQRIGAWPKIFRVLATAFPKDSVEWARADAHLPPVRLPRGGPRANGVIAGRRAIELKPTSGRSARSRLARRRTRGDRSV